MKEERKSLLWREAESLLVKHGMRLSKEAEGRYVVYLPSGDSVRFNSLTQIILLFKNITEKEVQT